MQCNRPFQIGVMERTGVLPGPERYAYGYINWSRGDPCHTRSAFKSSAHKQDHIHHSSSTFIPVRIQIVSWPVYTHVCRALLVFDMAVLKPKLCRLRVLVQRAAFAAVPTCSLAVRLGLDRSELFRLVVLLHADFGSIVASMGRTQRIHAQAIARDP
jgi:hypothetical protein